MDINKIRTNQLTEDEKMELIADYLSGGNGGAPEDVRLCFDSVAFEGSGDLDITLDTYGAIRDVARYIVEHGADAQLTRGRLPQIMLVGDFLIDSHNNPCGLAMTAANYEYYRFDGVDGWGEHVAIYFPNTYGDNVTLGLTTILFFELMDDGTMIAQYNTQANYQASENSPVI